MSFLRVEKTQQLELLDAGCWVPRRFARSWAARSGSLSERRENCRTVLHFALHFAEYFLVSRERCKRGCIAGERLTEPASGLKAEGERLQPLRLGFPALLKMPPSFCLESAQHSLNLSSVSPFRLQVLRCFVSDHLIIVANYCNVLQCCILICLLAVWLGVLTSARFL